MVCWQRICSATGPTIADAINAERLFFFSFSFFPSSRLYLPLHLLRLHSSVL